MAALAGGDDQAARRGARTATSHSHDGSWPSAMRALMATTTGAGAGARSGRGPRASRPGSWPAAAAPAARRWWRRGSGRRPRRPGRRPWRPVPGSAPERRSAAARAMAALTRLTRPGRPRASSTGAAGERTTPVSPVASTVDGSGGRGRRPSSATCRGSKSMRPRAARAAGGVGGPVLRRCRPTRTCGRGRRRPHDERVVGVGDHVRRRGGGEGAAPALGQLAHLVAAVELVAAQVQQDHRGRAGLGQHRRQPPLVDLEHGGGGRVGVAERGDDARAACWRPSELETTGRWCDRAAPSRRVVVVLPLVALTITTSRPAVRAGGADRRRRAATPVRR